MWKHPYLQNDSLFLSPQVTALVLLKAWVSWQSARRRPLQTLVLACPGAGEGARNAVGPRTGGRENQGLKYVKIYRKP